MSDSADYAGVALDPEVLRAMGEVAYWAARLEGALAGLIAEAASLSSKHAHVLTGRLQGKALVETVEDVLKSDPSNPRFANVLKNFRQHKKAMVLALDQRGLLMHGVWTFSADGPPRLGSRRRAEGTGVAQSLEEIQSTRTSLSIAAMDLEVMRWVLEGWVDYEFIEPAMNGPHRASPDAQSP